MKISFLMILFSILLLSCDAQDASIDAGADLADDFKNDANDVVPLGVPQQSRTIAEGCDNFRPNQSFNPAESDGCDDDADCTQGMNGRCVDVFSFLTTERSCTYDNCFKDSDCGKNTVCSCGKDEHNNQIVGRSDENLCVDANCQVDDDCGAQFCKPSQSGCVDSSDRVYGYYCTTEDDECRNNSDCENNIEGDSCEYWQEGDKWICTTLCE